MNATDPAGGKIDSIARNAIRQGYSYFFSPDVRNDQYQWNQKEQRIAPIASVGIALFVRGCGLEECCQADDARRAVRPASRHENDTADRPDLTCPLVVCRLRARGGSLRLLVRRAKGEDR